MFRTIQAHFNHTVRIIDKSGLVVDRRTLGRSGGKTSGQIIAPKETVPGIPNGLLFWDGAVCHLHANIEDIRFPTHSTNLEEILETIQRNFYR
ncbi:hypothetical protein H8E77_18485 [bacterium]|nr:hypothetical protein [bacterium]